MYHGNYSIRTTLFTRVLSQNPSFYNDIYRMLTWDRKRNLPEMKFRFTMTMCTFFFESRAKQNEILFRGWSEWHGPLNIEMNWCELICWKHQCKHLSNMLLIYDYLILDDTSFIRKYFFRSAVYDSLSKSEWIFVITFGWKHIFFFGTMIQVMITVPMPQQKYEQQTSFLYFIHLSQGRCFASDDFI